MIVLVAPVNILALQLCSVGDPGKEIPDVILLGEQVLGAKTVQVPLEGG